ncbi:MAG: FAD-linked oxidase C-terminal domain-containing protein [Gemmatimonadaceae bacterium]
MSTSAVIDSPAEPRPNVAPGLAPADIASVARRLAAIVGERRVLARPTELFTYTADGLPGYRKQPALAVFPGTRDEVVAVVRTLAELHLPFVARGAGTGLSGGALADHVVLLGLQRLTHILDVDLDNARAVVEPGTVNTVISRAVAGHGLYFAPDPSSQAACTIGGNVAENAGGPHCLKYGVTLNHVHALTVILPDGEIVALGNAAGESDGYDLLGAFIGSEGCFGVVLDATVRLSRDPQAVRTLLADFADVDDAARAVSGIIATGIVPAALEMMDNPTIRAVEASVYAAGYPADAAAVLLIELDGLAAGLDADVDRVASICRHAHARGVRIAADAAERARLWQGRKKAFGAMGRVAPHLVVQDAVVPRTQLPATLRAIREIGARHGVTVCNVFHAGDGNLHPNIPYDASNADEAARVERAMGEIMRACIDAGGTITGEHGVGLDKIDYMPLVFSDDSLATMCQLRDVFDPERRANPMKVVPVRSCREWGPRATSADWSASPAHESGARYTHDDVGRETSDAPLGTTAGAAADGAVAVGSGASPRSTPPLREETARIRDEIMSARHARTPVRIVAAASWLDAGRPAATTGTLAVRDDAIVEYNPGDLTMTARAGASLASLGEAARANGQFLALDPFGTASGTLGATLATASAGPLAHAFGTPRDNVLGVELVTGQGLVARGGGRVVKNVAGFDLTRLAIGSWGTLGAITEATVRLRAIPERDLTIAVALPDEARAATATLDRVRTLPLAAWVLEVVNGAVAAGLGLDTGSWLIARIAGNDPLVAAQAATLATLGDTTVVDGALWQRLRSIEPADAAVARVSTLPSAMPSLLGDALPQGAMPSGTLIHSTPSRGVIRCIVPHGALGSLRQAVGRARRHPSAPLTWIWERLPAAEWPALAPSAVETKLARRTRDAFDPHRILNRGILGEAMA